MAEIQEYFKSNARLKFHQDLEFLCLSYSTFCRLTCSLSIQYLLVCSTFILFFDEVGHQQRLDYNPLIFRHSYTFNVQEQFKINLRLKTEKN